MAMLEEPVKEIRTVRNYINGEWQESRGKLADVSQSGNLKNYRPLPDVH